jgi:hypothetical protein
MSDLQDKLDRDEITLDEYHDQWVAQMEEKERLNLGFPRPDVSVFECQYPGSH